MPVICSVCLETLVYRGVEPPPPGKHAVGLICGHLFHADCIGKSFQDNSAATVEGQVPVCGSCPLCQVVSSIGQSIKVYPSMDDDDMAGQLTAAQGRINLLTNQNDGLRTRVFWLRIDNVGLTAQWEGTKKKRDELLETTKTLTLENTNIKLENQNLRGEVSSLKTSVAEKNQELANGMEAIKEKESTLEKQITRDAKKLRAYKKRILNLRSKLKTFRQTKSSQEASQTSSPDDGILDAAKGGKGMLTIGELQNVETADQSMEQASALSS